MAFHPRSIRLAVSLVLLAISLTGGQASAQGNRGPHGGELVSDAGDLFEVSVNPSGRQVDVYALQSVAGPPRNLSITLFSFPGFEETVELQTTKLPRESLPHYQGQLSFLNSNFMGFELSFQFQGGGTRLVRSMKGEFNAEDRAGYGS
ncbi:MAG: hypothetical protein A2X94_02435 [Bdellovibrionales bacterium GWB1_55_8]|nr:MAG: hypothetical protein A2X94_02435 [Bdellovibrionales bacterium GWB1_55_8]